MNGSLTGFHKPCQFPTLLGYLETQCNYRIQCFGNTEHTDHFRDSNSKMSFSQKIVSVVIVGIKQQALLVHISSNRKSDELVEKKSFLPFHIKAILKRACVHMKRPSGNPSNGALHVSDVLIMPALGDWTYLPQFQLLETVVEDTRKNSKTTFVAHEGPSVRTLFSKEWLQHNVVH